MDLGLEGRVAIVTGGTHGIGWAIGWLLREEGCLTTVCSRRATERLGPNQGDNLLIIDGDVTDPDGPQKVIDATLNRWGHIDILVNNVGGGGRWGSPDPDAEYWSNIWYPGVEYWGNVWQKVMYTNLRAAVQFTNGVLPSMSGHGWGRVVTISSIHGREAGGRPWFAAAKSAQIAMMKSYAQQKRLARANITFNTVCPGSIMIPDTGWEREAKERPDEYASFCANLPMGRLGKPEEVASVVTFLCSEQARYVSGACFVVDGGESKAF